MAYFTISDIRDELLKGLITEADIAESTAYIDDIAIRLGVRPERIVSPVPFQVKTLAMSYALMLTALNASMTGNIWKIFVEAGQSVKKGETVAIIEAMKMELPVYADDDGIVKAIICRAGQTVHSGEPLVYMEYT